MGREAFVPPDELKQPGLEDALDFAQQLLSRASDRLGRNNRQRVKDHKYFSNVDFERLGKRLLKAPYVPQVSHGADASHFDVGSDDHEHIEPYTGSNDMFRDF